MSSPDLQPPLSPDPFQESPLPDHSLAILRRLDREIERRASSWMQILELTVRDLADAFAHFNWTGVYLVEGDDLVLGPYVGLPTEHLRIPIGRGICGAAAATGSTIVVDDVRQDPRYLSCFVSTRSEIVVPILIGDRVIGEIDIDSDQPAAFGATDRTLLEAVAERLARLAPSELR